MGTTTNNLFVLISQRKDAVIKSLVSTYGVDMRDEDKRTPLIHAAFYNNIELTTWLIDNDANLNASDRNGYTALHFACEKGNQEIVNLLISRGANINQPDYYGNTPAWIAITYWKRGQNMPVLKELYHHDANLYQKNNAGFSAADILPMNVLNSL